MNKEMKVLVNQIVASKILSVQEKKSFDTGFGSTVDNTGSISKLTTIPQNDTDSGRDGDHVKLLRLELRASFVFADATNSGRLIIAKWTQDDSSAAPSSITNVLQTATPYSPYDRDNERAGKFIVIYDHLFVVGATGPNIESIDVSIPLKGQIAFQATATTGTGHIYAFMVSDSSAVTHPVFNWVARTYFTDS